MIKNTASKNHLNDTNFSHSQTYRSYFSISNITEIPKRKKYIMYDKKFHKLKKAINKKKRTFILFKILKVIFLTCFLVICLWALLIGLFVL